MAGKFWTNQEIAFVRENYLKLSNKELSEKLGRTVRSVQHKMEELKYVRPEPQIGDKFGKLTLVEKYIESNGKQNRTIGVFDCDCGKEYHGVLSQVSTGNISACGCMSGSHNAKELIETGKSHTHGMTHTRIYNIWYGMKSRCTNPKSDYNNRYINRGITLCDEWLDFRCFSDWANENGYIDGKDCSLERIDVDGNYCPENCKWIKKLEQAHNRTNSKTISITAFDETKSIYKWVNDNRCNISINALIYRIHAGWEPERAITQPPERERKLGLDKWIRKYRPDIFEEYNKFYE